MKLVTILLFTLVVAVFAKTRTNGFSGLYGTGLQANGNRITLGSADPHWTLAALVRTGQTPQDSTVWPGGVPSTPAPLYVVDAQNHHGRSGPCSNTHYDCYWISPVSNANMPLPGDYFYYLQTTFVIDSQVNVNTANFTISVSAADTVRAVLINGIDTASVAGSSDKNSAAFSNNGPDRYTIFQFDNTHGEFRAGVNTLELVVEHAYGNPTGLSVGIVNADASLNKDAFGNTIVSALKRDALARNNSCGDFNIYTPGSPLPDGYQDLSDIFPGIVLDENGRVTLPCVPALSAEGSFIPQVLSVSYSSYGQPICAVIVDCNSAGSGSITATVSNVNRGESYNFVALELCSNNGVFFGCVDSAYGQRLSASLPGETGLRVTGEFSDTIQVTYNNNGLVSNTYNVYLVCGGQAEFNFSTVSGLLLRDALSNNIEKLLRLREKVVDVQYLLFNNTQNIPCAEIAQSTDLSQTALDFFNFLDCLGNRELSEDAFLYSLTNNSTLPNHGLCTSQ